MAVDKFTLSEDQVVGGAIPDPPADAWKDKSVQREHTPAKVKSNLTYRQIENEIEMIDNSIASQEARKAELEADLEKIEAVANPSE